VPPLRPPGPRFFADGAYAVGDIVELRGADARKLTVVLRARSGDPLEICDSTGRSFAATLEAGSDRVRARLGAVVDRPREPSVETVLAQAVPKGAKMDFVVEKATELGVARIVPVLTERTVAEPAGGSKVERWRRLARAAAQQCGRTRVPEVAEPALWDAVLAAAQPGDLLLFPWELADREPLRERLPSLLAGAHRVIVLIGPEGGITHAEAERAIAAGAHAVSLGARILRTETAGLAVLGAIAYETGEM
jgi:16S rRNA (uracil1498-N3)-methyltransferase